MPHLTFEITANLAAEADIPGLLEKANATLIAQRTSDEANGAPVFPIGGTRSRAIVLDHYRVADGAEDDAFVHATLKVAAGRTPAVLKAAGDALFEVMKAHFAALYAKRYLALSLEIFQFDDTGTWKHNNIHARYKKT